MFPDQDFAGVAADMQARFDAAMQRERDSHSAQLQVNRAHATD